MKIEVDLSPGKILAYIALASAVVGAVSWFIEANLTHTYSKDRWEEYGLLWDEPIEERRSKVQRALKYYKEEGLE